MAVGIFDSGLGGLTVLDAVAKRLPDVSFVYFGDNKHTPYGVRDPQDIYDLTTRRGAVPVRPGLRPGDPRLQHRLGGRASADAGGLGAA
jgi:hypothetical protein